MTLTSELPGNVLTMSLDPMNVTMEAEHFPDVDLDRYARRKPLLWFWKMFDRSPIGLNHWLGIRFRCMLGRHIFEHVGSSVKIHNGVDITYGYNLWIGDNVVIRSHALFNDRGGIRIGSNSVIGSYARVYSQVHNRQMEDVRLQTTVIGERARIGSHEIVLAGQNVADGTMVGSFPAEDR
jgi:acetyltransferase-like isoleucine patch superfamily enzyme